MRSNPMIPSRPSPGPGSGQGELFAPDFPQAGRCTCTCDMRLLDASCRWPVASPDGKGWETSVAEQLVIDRLPLTCQVGVSWRGVAASFLASFTSVLPSIVHPFRDPFARAARACERRARNHVAAFPLPVTRTQHAPPFFLPPPE